MGYLLQCQLTNVRFWNRMDLRVALYASSKSSPSASFLMPLTQNLCARVARYAVREMRSCCASCPKQETLAIFLKQMQTSVAVTRYLNDDFAFRMSLPKVGKSFFCFRESKYLVDHRLDLFSFYEFTDLSKLIAIRPDKKK